MNMVTLSLNTPINLTTRAGTVEAVMVQEVRWKAEKHYCMITGTVERNQWRKIWTDGLFHLSPEAILHDEAEFEESGPITLELVLDKSVLQSLLAYPDPLDALLRGLAGASAESAQLLECTNWRACSVMQEIPVPFDPDTTLQIGFQTIWAEDNLDF